MIESTERIAFRNKETKEFFDFASLNGSKQRIWTKYLRDAKLYTSAVSQEAITDLRDTLTDPRTIENVTIIITMKVSNN